MRITLLLLLLPFCAFAQRPMMTFGAYPYSTPPSGGGSGAFYVSTSGNDSNDGLSAATPFATVAHAISKVNTSTNNLILIGAGLYNQGAATLMITKSGTASNPVTIMALDSNTWPSDVIISNSYTGSSETPALEISEASNVVVRGIVIEGNQTATTYDGATYAILVSDTLTTYPGVMIDHCELRNFDQGCYVWGTGDTGTSGFTFRSNFVHDCEHSGLYTRSDKSNLPSGSNYHPMVMQNPVVTWNVISNITGLAATGAYALPLFISESTNAFVFGNWITNIGSNVYVPGLGGPAGIELNQAAGGYIGWNAIQSVRWNSYQHVDGAGLNTQEDQNTLWEHNYIRDTDGGGYIAYISGGVMSSNVIRFNVFVNTGLLRRGCSTKAVTRPTVI